MVLYSHTKAAGKSVGTNDALMEGEYLPQSFKSTSTSQYRKISSQNRSFLLSSSTAPCRMHSSECMHLFQTWLQSAKVEQSVAVAESQPTSSSLSLCRTDRLHHGRRVVPSPFGSQANLPLKAAQLLLLSVRRFIQIYICFYIHMMCFTQQLLCTRQKESKPFVSPPTGWSGSLSWSSLRRNLDFQTSEQAGGTAVPNIPQLGPPSSGTFLWGSRSRVRFLREKRNIRLWVPWSGTAS